MIYLETERLILRDWKKEDLYFFQKMNADTKVMKYFPKILTTVETNLFYHQILSGIKTNGYGLYAVEQKSKNQFIGFIGFHEAQFEADFTPCIEIGWRLQKDAWGHGYATEGGRACLEYGFNELGFQEIYSFTSELNRPSWNVMKKIGMNFIKTFNHPKLLKGHPLEKHVLYHINNPGKGQLYGCETK